ncbi:MAG: DUF2807 domain-containing protein [Clostridia bacterium]|nr:DUF2807 domain-containing protein [Clostridia bacterium]
MSFASEDIICPRIDVKASGTAKMNIVGEGDSLSAKVSGYCKITAEKFSLNTLNLDASGSVNMTVSVKDEINASASGSIKVSYYGDPKITRSGSGSNNFEKIG